MDLEKKNVAIIILNYRGFEDTIKCLHSAKLQEYKSYDIFVVDNDSGDGSYERILTECGILSPQKMSHDRVCRYGVKIDKSVSLYIIKTVYNGGFAYGNNAGIEFAKTIKDYKYFLLCNNDLILSSDTLQTLIDDIESPSSANNNVGLIGAKLNYWHDPSKIQAIAGTYQPLIARSTHITSHASLTLPLIQQHSPFDYPIGACMLVTNTLIESIGLLSEDYFLYFEELDYVKRANQVGITFAISTRSTILHKEGASIGSSSLGNKSISALADFHLLKGRLIFTKKFYPKYIFSVLILHFVNIFRRLFRGEFLKSYNAIKSIRVLFHEK
ncbi:glycosyltransferase family 2 protein [Vibrio cyclitrophicus]|nr:glycosyltransferase family 2 protein [Vibrio cyclitrophicus]UPR47540.1 glycosyltransferase family 2 protein [Vibrio cyclitrophicus]